MTTTRCPKTDLTFDEARKLTDRIRQVYADFPLVTQQIRAAYHHRDWVALGYDSWESYCAAEFGAHAGTVDRLLGARSDVPGVDDRPVYFIQPVDGGLIKIGVATLPERRLADIQRMSPVRLRIVGVIAGIGQAGEAELHSRFAAARAWGEWFHPIAELCDYIRQYAAPAPVGAR